MTTALTAHDSDGSLASTVERETKLMVDETFRLPSLPGRTLPRRVFTTTYYDTLDHCAAHAHMTLRYRLEGGLGSWQMKLPLDGNRREVELRGVAGKVPTAFSDALVVHHEGKQLVPIATLRTWRTGIRVETGGRPVADVVLDTVSVMKEGEIVQRFRELEVEWLNGDAQLVDRVVQALHRAGARSHDGRPKLFRALSLSYDLPPPPAKEAPVRDHLRYALMKHVQALKRFDPGTRLGGEPEDLHQMRVATRRLRTMLRSTRRLLNPEWAEPLLSGLSWLGQLLRLSRDLDVQAEYFRNEATQLGARDRRPVERFVLHLQGERRKAQQMLLDEMRSARYVGFISKLQQDAYEPVMVDSTRTLGDVAAREFRKLSRVVRELPRSPSNSELHRVRIKAKRARYAAELAEPCVGKQAARFAKAVKTFQDLLGLHQDAVLAERYVREFVTRLHGGRVAFVAGLLVARAHQRRDEVRETFQSVWKRVKKRGKKAWR